MTVELLRNQSEPVALLMSAFCSCHHINERILCILLKKTIANFNKYQRQSRLVHYTCNAM